MESILKGLLSNFRKTIFKDLSSFSAPSVQAQIDFWTNRPIIIDVEILRETTHGAYIVAMPEKNVSGRLFKLCV